MTSKAPTRDGTMKEDSTPVVVPSTDLSGRREHSSTPASRQDTIRSEKTSKEAISRNTPCGFNCATNQSGSKIEDRSTSQERSIESWISKSRKSPSSSYPATNYSVNKIGDRSTSEKELKENLSTFGGKKGSITSENKSKESSIFKSQKTPSGSQPAVNSSEWKMKHLWTSRAQKDSTTSQNKSKESLIFKSEKSPFRSYPALNSSESKIEQNLSTSGDEKSSTSSQNKSKGSLIFKCQKTPSRSHAAINQIKQNLSTSDAEKVSKTSEEKSNELLIFKSQRTSTGSEPAVNRSEWNIENVFISGGETGSITSEKDSREAMVCNSPENCPSTSPKSQTVSFLGQKQALTSRFEALQSIEEEDWTPDNSYFSFGSKKKAESSTFGGQTVPFSSVNSANRIFYSTEYHTGSFEESKTFESHPNCYSPEKTIEDSSLEEKKKSKSSTSSFPFSSAKESKDLKSRSDQHSSEQIIQGSSIEDLKKAKSSRSGQKASLGSKSKALKSRTDYHSKNKMGNFSILSFRKGSIISEAKEKDTLSGNSGKNIGDSTLGTIISEGRTFSNSSTEKGLTKLSAIPEFVRVVTDCAKQPHSCVLCGYGIRFSKCACCENEAHNNCIEAFFCTIGKKIDLHTWKCPKCVTMSSMKKEEKSEKRKKTAQNESDQMVQKSKPIPECPFCRIDMELKDCQCQDSEIYPQEYGNWNREHTDVEGGQPGILPPNKCQCRDFGTNIDYKYFTENEEGERGNVKCSICWSVCWFLLLVTLAVPIAIMCSPIFIIVYCFEACCGCCQPVSCFFLEGIKLPGTCCRCICSGAPMCITSSDAEW